MATRRPIVLVSGVQSELPNNDGIYAASITSSLLEVYNITGVTTVSGTSILGSLATISNITGTTTVSGASVLGNTSSLTSTSSASAFIPTGSSVPSNGMYLPATNTVGLASDGTGRISFGTTGAVFNDTGDNFDLRVEGDTEANLIVVDASADAVGFGTASPAVRCDVNGNVRASSGILFGTDTAAANTLDDYEEGTFTPYFASDTGGTWPGATTNSCSYTKIGRVVHIFGVVTYSSKAAGAASVIRLRGLPFTPAIADQAAPEIGWQNVIPDSGNYKIRISTTDLVFYAAGALQGSGLIGLMPASGTYQINFLYIV